MSKSASSRQSSRVNSAGLTSLYQNTKLRRAAVLLLCGVLAYGTWLVIRWQTFPGTARFVWDITAWAKALLLVALAGGYYLVFRLGGWLIRDAQRQLAGTDRARSSVSSRSNAVVTLLVSGLIVSWILFKVPDPATFLIDADGAHQLVGANQILLTSEQPFIDFRATYGPLTFYTSAAGQLLFDKRIIGEVLITVAGYAIAYSLLFRLLRQASGRLEIAVVLMILALILMPRMYKYYIVLGPIFALTAAWCYIDRPQRKAVIFLALTIVMTGLFRPDFGAYATICGMVTVFTFPAASVRARMKRMLFLLGSILLCAAPWLIWAFANNGLGSYLRESTLGAIDQASQLALPFPSFQVDLGIFSPNNATFLSYVFFLSVPLAAIAVLIRNWKISTAQQRSKILVAALFAALALLQALHRIDYYHLLQSITISYILIGWLVGHLVTQIHNGTVWQKLRSAPLLMPVAGMIIVSSYAAYQTGALPVLDITSLSTNLSVYSDSRENFLPRLKYLASDNWQIAAMLYIRQCTKPLDRIFIVPLLTSFYYITDRPFAGGMIELYPGAFDTADDEIRTVNKLSRENVAMIIDWPDFTLDGNEKRKVANYAPVLSRYIYENFAEIARFGPVIIKVPKDQTPPHVSTSADQLLCYPRS